MPKKKYFLTTLTHQINSIIRKYTEMVIFIHWLLCILTSLGMQTWKTIFVLNFALFYCFFFRFRLFHIKTWKNNILTSFWSVLHPNTGQNIQNLHVYCLNQERSIMIMMIMIIFLHSKSVFNVSNAADRSQKRTPVISFLSVFCVHSHWISYRNDTEHLYHAFVYSIIIFFLMMMMMI